MYKLNLQCIQRCTYTRLLYTCTRLLSVLSKQLAVYTPHVLSLLSLLTVVPSFPSRFRTSFLSSLSCRGLKLINWPLLSLSPVDKPFC